MLCVHSTTCFKGHNLPSKNMPGNKSVYLNFKFDSEDKI